MENRLVSSIESSVKKPMGTGPSVALSGRNAASNISLFASSESMLKLFLG